MCTQNWRNLSPLSVRRTGKKQRPLKQASDLLGFPTGGLKSLAITSTSDRLLQRTTVNSPFCVSEIQPVEAYFQMRNKLHLTQLFFQTSTDPWSLTAHKWEPAKKRHFGFVTQDYSETMLTCSSSCSVSGSAQEIP